MTGVGAGGDAADIVKGKRTIRQKTGAPPAYFLLNLEVENGTYLLVENSRKERASLATASTDEIKKQIWWALLELAERVVWPKITPRGRLDQTAGRALAAMATSAASILEDLAFSSSIEVKRAMKCAAANKNYWPVKLGLGLKRKKDGKCYQVLEGANKAKDYLVSIRLGKGCPTPVKHGNDASVSLFKRAAEYLLEGLLAWREEFARREKAKETRWLSKLLSLDYPMTQDNVDDWWAVSKRWMDEQWEANQKLFGPLIMVCSVSILAR